MQPCPHCHHQNTSTALFCRGCGQPLGARAQVTGALLTGALLQRRYRILALVGQGGMAAVYQAEDVRLPGVRCAVKEMSDAQLTDPAERARAIAAFQQEARLLAALSHPNLPKVTDCFDQAGKQYLVMEFVDGQTLEEIMEAARPHFLDEAQILGWIGQVCDVLVYLHSRQPPIIFRDLKPANIMLNRQSQVKLIDFGIARHFKPGQTADTTPMGTPGYAAPEAHGKGQTDARSDIYSLGVTLHTLLTRYDPGTTPFGLPTARSLNPAVSLHMEGVIGRATQIDAAQRYQSAAEMKQALFHPAPWPTPAPTGATRQVPIPGRSPSPPPPPTGRTWSGPPPAGTGPSRSPTPPPTPSPMPGVRPKSVSPLAVGAGLLLALALVAGGLLLLAGGGGTTYTPSRTPTAFSSPTSGGGTVPSATRQPTSTAESATTTRSPGSPSRTPTPRPTATRLGPTATRPRPTATLPRPTATLTPKPTDTPVPACAFNAQGEFASLWQTYRAQLGCPLQQRPQAIQDAEQPFQNGRMLWRMDTRQIYVIYEQGGRAGTFQTFADRWQEGQAEYPCSASPPPGVVQPRRGFGRVWCQLGAANAPIGWGLAEELGFGGSYAGEPLVQDFEGGVILRDNDGAARGLAYVLFGNGAFVRVRY